MEAPGDRGQAAGLALAEEIIAAEADRFEAWRHNRRHRTGRIDGAPADFPVFINLRGATALLVGGGKVAARRAEKLLAAGALVHVVSPEICGAMEKLLGRAGLRWTRGGYDNRQTGVKYTGATYASAQQVRSSRASTTYTDASGYNNIFFGSGGGGGMTFTVEDIVLWGQTGVKLVFGSYSYTGNYSTSELTIEYRLGAGDWMPLTYTRASDMRVWGLATSATIPTTGKSSIALRWTNSTTNEYRIDDMMLVQDGTIVPLPNPPTDITTTAALAISRTMATVGASFVEGAGNPATRVGVEYRVSGSADAWTKVVAAFEPPAVVVTLTGLTAATTYEYRAYVTTAADTYVDQTTPIKTFTTDVASTLAYVNPTVSGTLTVGTASAANLLINHTGAVGGEAVSVSVAVTGAGGAGLTSPITYSGTLAAGAGTITIPIKNGALDWTPSAAGDAIFTPTITTTHKTDPAVVLDPALSPVTATVSDVLPPAQPTALAVPAVNITRTGAQVTFTAGVDATGTEVTYKKSTESTWTTATGTTSPVTLTGLTAGTAYNVRARSVNAGIYSDYVATVNFSTTGPAFSQAVMDAGSSLVVGTAAAATISIPYTNGIATTYDLTVTPSGVGADGLSAWTENGVAATVGGTALTLTVPATWTPTTAGAITFTISGLPADVVAPITVVNATVSPAATGGNLLLNPGFEAYSGDMPDSWEKQANAGTFTKITTEAHSGSNAIQVNTTTETTGISQNVAVTAGTNYEFSYWYKDNTKGAAAQGVRIWCTFRSSSGTIANNTVTVISGSGLQPSTPAIATEWTQYVTVVTAPTGAVSVDFQVRVTGSAASPNHTGTFDDCSLTLVP
jgi:hypothetical protein